MDKVIKSLLSKVKSRILSGFGVSDFNQPKQKFKGLKDSYVSFRQRYKSLSSKTTPRTSNVTLTGKMLDSMIAVLLKNKIVFKFKTKAAQDKADKVTKDRPFMSLTTEENRFFKEEVKRVVTKDK